VVGECKHDWRFHLRYTDDGGFDILIFCWDCDQPASGFAELQQMHMEYEQSVIYLTEKYVEALRNG
jgi:hypothetical protein